MASYHVLCVRMMNPAAARDHTVIRALGGSGWEFTVAQVIDRLTAGHSFFSTNRDGQHPRPVEVCQCGGSTTHVRSKADYRTDNNLESLPDCPR